jgi:hypothetical protein
VEDQRGQPSRIRVMLYDIGGGQPMIIIMFAIIITAVVVWIAKET